MNNEQSPRIVSIRLINISEDINNKKVYTYRFKVFMSKPDEKERAHEMILEYIKYHGARASETFELRDNDEQ